MDDAVAIGQAIGVGAGSHTRRPDGGGQRYTREERDLGEHGPLKSKRRARGVPPRPEAARDWAASDSF